MATFAGKQVGYADPKMDHETDIQPAPCGETIVFSGKQAGYPDPTMIGCIKRREDVQG